MAYTEYDKLHFDIEKIKLEIETLKHPYTKQPTTWFTMFGLLISIVFNYSQCSNSKSEQYLANIKYEQTKLLNLQSDESLTKARLLKDSLDKQIVIVKENLKNLQMQPKDIQSRIVDLSKTLKQLPKNKETSEITESVNRISTLNQNVADKLQASSLSFIKNPTKDLLFAAEKERQGFINLINGDYNNAILSFQASENSYNGYHRVYELARLVRSQKAEFNDLNKRKRLFQLIIDKYSIGAPKDLLKQLKDIVDK